MTKGWDEEGEWWKGVPAGDEFDFWRRGFGAGGTAVVDEVVVAHFDVCALCFVWKDGDVLFVVRVIVVLMCRWCRWCRWVVVQSSIRSNGRLKSEI